MSDKKKIPPMFDIIRGPKGTPNAEWTEVYQCNLDGDPDYIREMHVRRMNWDEAYEAKLNPQRYGPDATEFNWNGGRYIQYEYTMRPVPKERNFHARELGREDYVPFDIQPEEYSYAEVVGTKISFFARKRDAEQNHRTEMRFGRFLTHYTSLSATETAELTAKHNLDFETGTFLKWANTPEEVGMVYAEGPDSCMVGEVGSRTNCRVQQYGTSDDVAVAYLERDGEITARTVCNTKTKKFVRIYGDEIRLGALLAKEGYEHDYNALDQVKLKMLPGARGALPYLDGNHNTYESDCGQYWHIVPHNQYGINPPEPVVVEHDGEPQPNIWTIDPYAVMPTIRLRPRPDTRAQNGYEPTLGDILANALNQGPQF